LKAGMLQELGLSAYGYRWWETIYKLSAMKVEVVS